LRIASPLIKGDPRGAEEAIASAEAVGDHEAAQAIREAGAYQE
jgi:hypothetical protein